MDYSSGATITIDRAYFETICRRSVLPSITPYYLSQSFANIPAALGPNGS